MCHLSDQFWFIVPFIGKDGDGPWSLGSLCGIVQLCMILTP
jgi:hypothetical protein